MQHSLQDLQEVWCSEALLLCLPAMYRAAQCCPNLWHLHLEGQVSSRGGWVVKALLPCSCGLVWVFAVVRFNAGRNCCAVNDLHLSRLVVENAPVT